ncbi:MAG TPA: hypothetical protein PLZ55_14975, partial [bacterium]|nr:hypothetical protein [bacterium]
MTGRNRGSILSGSDISDLHIGDARRTARLESEIPAGVRIRGRKNPRRKKKKRNLMMAKHTLWTVILMLSVLTAWTMDSAMEAARDTLPFVSV